jgi:phosphoglycolate phosphatase-like HAD superfamily hydrolase
MTGLARKRRSISAAVLLSVLAFVPLVTAVSRAQTAVTLPSWNNGRTRQSIIDFVAKVTDPNSAEFVPPAERIAAFDNDGTLWAEQPLYFELKFALDRVNALAPQHPEWKTQEPFNRLIAGDVTSFIAGARKSVMAAVAVSHSGMTTEEFQQIVREWLARARHPRTGRPYTAMVYQPMIELLLYLRANGFKTYIVSGGGLEFMRAFAETTYGIPPEQVIGSQGRIKFEVRNGKPVLVKLADVQYVDDKGGKPIGIQTAIGRRPIAAFGNSDADLQMLQWTAAGSGARLCVFVHHTDDEREWAYDRESGIGRLDKGLDEARSKGWVVVDMKDDWNTIFPQTSVVARD